METPPSITMAMKLAYIASLSMEKDTPSNIARFSSQEACLSDSTILTNFTMVDQAVTCTALQALRNLGNLSNPQISTIKKNCLLNVQEVTG